MLKRLAMDKQTSLFVRSNCDEEKSFVTVLPGVTVFKASWSLGLYWNINNQKKLPELGLLNI
jgi:hypothetical protein